MPENDVLFASRYERRDFSLPGVRRVQFRAPKERSGQQSDVLVHNWSRAVAMGRQAYSSFQQLHKLNYEPDMVIFSAGNGVSLFLERAFPHAFRVAYLDSSLVHAGSVDPDVRAAAVMVQGASLFGCHMAFAFSSSQREAIPPILQPSIGLVPLSVDTAFFSQEAASPYAPAGEDPLSGGTELVSVSIKGAEGLVESGILRVITALLLNRPMCHVHLSCGFRGGVQFLQRYFSGLEASCLSRLHISDFLKRPEYRDILCASAVHICPAKTRSLLVEMLETMSSGSVLLCAPADPALVPGKNMFAWPETPQRQFECISGILNNAALRKKIGGNARKVAMENFRQDEFLPRHAGTLLESCREWQEKHARASAAEKQL